MTNDEARKEQLCKEIRETAKEMSETPFCLEIEIYKLREKVEELKKLGCDLSGEDPIEDLLWEEDEDEEEWD